MGFRWHNPLPWQQLGGISRQFPDIPARVFPVPSVPRWPHVNWQPWRKVLAQLPTKAPWPYLQLPAFQPGPTRTGHSKEWQQTPPCVSEYYCSSAEPLGLS